MEGNAKFQFEKIKTSFCFTIHVHRPQLKTAVLRSLEHLVTELRARVSVCFPAVDGHRSRMAFPSSSNYITIYILLLKKIRFLGR